MFSILIVDDHKHLVESMAMTIPWAEHGVTEVHQAYSGQEALAVIASTRIDIIVTDIRMPVMSGLELIERVRSLSPDTDCILLTGYAEFQYAKRAVELQAVDYLIKPVRDEELLNSIRKITEKQTKRRAVRQEAERAVLEERNRIAQDIHDIVGHTLTTTLIQIEAAKRLIVRNEQEGLNRLEKSQELVRQGLEDIRQTVSQIKQPGHNGDLKAELERLIVKAEQAAHITVSRHIELPGPVQPSLLCKTIYHALQEGITNGIRHGRASRFQFRLTVEDGKLLFSLWNDGIPYHDELSGFGITAMKERVEQLGGSITISPSDCPAGTKLRIVAPFEWRHSISDE
jgi:two-component system sensor histidine kinase ChiS